MNDDGIEDDDGYDEDDTEILDADDLAYLRAEIRRLARRAVAKARAEGLAPGEAKARADLALIARFYAAKSGGGG